MTIQEQIIQAAQSLHIPGMKPISNPFVEVLHIETFTDFIYANLYVGGFYYLLYLIAGGNSAANQASSNTLIRLPSRLRVSRP